MRRSLLAVALVLAAAPASAQSKRYPPTPKDPDREAEHHSKLWEQTLAPGRAPYQLLVHDAKLLGDDKAPDALPAARQKLEAAIALLPNEPDAFVVRGEIELARRNWAACADDLAAAEDRARTDDAKSPERIGRRLELGICQARAGRYVDAERTLIGVSGATPNTASGWIRLGEVRIALGKLDEAVGALDTALESCTPTCDPPTSALIHYFLASAYDRARLPKDAEDHIRIAAQLDRGLGQIVSPRYPFLGAGEGDYLQGLAHRFEAVPKLEHALAHFRRFLRLAADSPWRRRAEDHVRDLSTLDYPVAVQRIGGTITPDLDAARVAVGKVMPQMRACMARLPTSVLEVSIVRNGPRTPPGRDHAIVRMLPPGVTVRDVLELDAPARTEVDAAIKCVEPLAERMTLPPIKERDTYFVIAFNVAAP